MKKSAVEIFEGTLGRYSGEQMIGLAIALIADVIREGLSELVKSNKILLLERKLTEEEVEFGKHCCFISNDNDVAGLIDKDCQGDDFYLCDLCAKRDPR